MSVAEYQAALPKLFEGTEDNKKSQANNDEDQGKKKVNTQSFRPYSFVQSCH